MSYVRTSSLLVYPCEVCDFIELVGKGVLSNKFYDIEKKVFFKHGTKQLKKWHELFPPLDLYIVPEKYKYNQCHLKGKHTYTYQNILDFPKPQYGKNRQVYLSTDKAIPLTVSYLEEYHISDNFILPTLVLQDKKYRVDIKKCLKTNRCVEVSFPQGFDLSTVWKKYIAIKKKYLPLTTKTNMYL